MIIAQLLIFNDLNKISHGQHTNYNSHISTQIFISDCIVGTFRGKGVGGGGCSHTRICSYIINYKFIHNIFKFHKCSLFSIFSFSFCPYDEIISSGSVLVRVLSIGMVLVL